MNAFTVFCKRQKCQRRHEWTHIKHDFITSGKFFRPKNASTVHLNKENGKQGQFIKNCPKLGKMMKSL